MVQVHMTSTKFEQKAAELQEKHGLTLTETAGRIEKDGVTAGYTHYNDTLTVHIIDKPVFISTAYCEQQIAEWLNS
jgi:hypothetical protein